MKKLAITLAVAGVAAAAGYGWYRHCHPFGAYATPQACFAAMNEAHDQKDFARYLSCVSTRVQNQQIGWLAYQLQREAADNPKTRARIVAIYEKHHLKGINVMELLQIHSMPSGKGTGYALDVVGSRVTDKAAFLAEADAIFSPKENPAKPAEKPALVEVKIEGDFATAKIKTKDGKSYPIFFRRIDQSWVIAEGRESDTISPSPEEKRKDQRKDFNKRPPPELSPQEKDALDRRQAARALGETGPKAIPALTEFLKDKDEDVRSIAAYSLGRLGPKAKAAIPALTDVLKDKRGCGEGRGNAARALGSIGPEAKTAIPALTELLRDSHQFVRRAAAQGLGGIGRAAVPVLTELLGDKDPKVRMEAAWALNQIGADASAAVPALAESLRDKDADVRRTAVWALTSVGPTAIPVLTALLKDKDGEVRGHAAFALAGIYGVSPGARTGQEAKTAIAALTDLLKDKNTDARMFAAYALGHIGPEAATAVPALTESLKDKEAAVRRNAADAIGQIGSESRAAVSALAKLLPDEDMQVHRSATEALTRLGPAAVPVLTELLKHEDYQLRAGAARVLGEMGPKAKSAIPDLTELLKDKELEVQQAAADALEKIKVEKE
jgi:HEAT repeat protein